MSKELTVKHEDNWVIYENDECVVIFSKVCSPLHVTKQIYMTARAKTQEGQDEKFKNVPVTIVWSEDKFKELIEYLNSV